MDQDLADAGAYAPGRCCMRTPHFMAARQLAGRRPLYFTADVSILLLYFFFRRLISGVSGPIVTKLRHMFDGDCNF